MPLLIPTPLPSISLSHFPFLFLFPLAVGGALIIFVRIKREVGKIKCLYKQQQKLQKMRSNLSKNIIKLDHFRDISWGYFLAHEQAHLKNTMFSR